MTTWMTAAGHILWGSTIWGSSRSSLLAEGLSGFQVISADLWMEREQQGKADTELCLLSTVQNPCYLLLPLVWEFHTSCSRAIHWPPLIKSLSRGSNPDTLTVCPMESKELQSPSDCFTIAVGTCCN